jgi:hypothetical protein
MTSTRRKKIRPEDKVPFRLSPRKRDLILEHACAGLPAIPVRSIAVAGDPQRTICAGTAGGVVYALTRSP